jgi:mRNA export factor
MRLTGWFCFVQVLCSAWKDDGLTVFSGGCDKQVKMWPLLSGAQPTVFSGHEAPIKELAWVPQMNLLVSGSWDKTLRCRKFDKTH